MVAVVVVCKAISAMSQHATARAGKCNALIDASATTCMIVYPPCDDHAELLYNTTTNSNHWISASDDRRQKQPDGIGTRIKLTEESGLVHTTM